MQLLEIAKVFTELNIDETRAFELAETINDKKDLVTKEALSETEHKLENKIEGVETKLRTEIIQNKNDLEKKIEGVETKLRTEIIQNKNDLEKKIEGVETKLRTEIIQNKNDLEKQIIQVKLSLNWLKGIGMAIVALLIKQVFFGS